MSGQNSDNSALSRARYRELGALVSERRAVNFPTVAEFVEMLKLYGVDYTEAMVRKIEHGDRPINPKHVGVFAQLLFGPKLKDSGQRRLEQADAMGRDRKSAPAFVAAGSVMRSNAERLKKVNEQNKALEELLRGALSKMESNAKRGAALMDSITTEIAKGNGLGAARALDEIAREKDRAPASSEAEAALRGYRSGLAKDLSGLLGGLGAGGVGGAVAGGGVAALTFASVSALATASTGAAISTLSGAAATSATLAWLGGGTLAGGAAGMAGGIAVLTGIVGIVAAAGVAVVLVGTGPRMLSKQREQAAELERIERNHTRNADVIARFVNRASIVDGIVTVGEIRVDTIKNLDGDSKYEALAKILVALATVMALPLTPIKNPDAEGELFDGKPADAQFVDLALSQARREISLARP
ncbi:hypothetical protein [Cellulomonas sp. Leaf395]|uniref:hypothetical protein n=1 Tax=Cellulomonas sp. Leaf395 TaxID=1736362 RepID=UPI0012FAB18C|nr:hypothetical protein [Cellulomonas sp. Leaf395]